MIFETGTVHCDPHPGNVLVTDDEAVSVGWWGWLTGAKAPHRLVLLDHGLYRRLDTAFRENYCRLWAAMVLMDSDEITRVAERMGLGRYAQWLPLIFTYRASGSSTLSGERMLPSERDKLRDELRGELDVSNISDLLYSMPEDMLFVARTQALLRNSCRALGIVRCVEFPHSHRLCVIHSFSAECPGSSESSVAARHRASEQHAIHHCTILAADGCCLAVHSPVCSLATSRASAVVETIHAAATTARSRLVGLGVVTKSCPDEPLVIELSKHEHENH